MRNVPVRAAFAALALAAAPLVSSPALAQAYPNKPVRVIVPSAPGGTLDILTRAVAQKLSEQVGQQFVVENRAAVTTIVGEEAAVRSAPDGYTLVMTGLPLATSPYLRTSMPFDPQKDLEPISLVASSANVLVVNPNLQARTVKELIDLAKSRSDPLFYGTPAHGSTGHLAAEMFNQLAGTRLQQVPYRGSAPALTDLMAGQIHMTFDNVPAAIGHIRSGKLRPIAVTSTKRTAQLPEVPTMAEAGLAGYAITAWFGLLAPARTPPEIIARLNAETVKALNSADLRERFAGIGFEPIPSTAAEFRQHIASESDRLGKLIRAANIKPAD